MHKKEIINSNSNNCINTLRDSISNYIKPVVKSGRPLVILCIGTDRSTGDSLGPLVGEKLKFLDRDNVFVYGNLKTPVHSKNLQENINLIYSTYNNPFIVAIDASLGSLQSIGSISLQNKPLRPGAAMNKDLPPIGDISITGIVNISGGLEFMVLQNTRLYVVMRLADIISKGVYHSIIKTIGGKNTASNVI
ncbi:spore protease YyaC [Oceanirhabdus seepicola]|uniref:Spore protease YyaC n=1 Tax=Oceanirhabdus seepicola TaxID=2828781 RepID=A0A9J6P681_9CLOT|nr:spore protease YyaC [Oceanirhabdus seepicola]MCM1992346.1 spore protease YyaC [Oceanirhabdus seepicola]